MLEKYLKQTEFTGFEDFKANYKLIVPEQFNFGYDVVDAWAAREPNKKALLWTNDKGDCREFTFAEIKKYTDQTASYFQTLGLKKGDIVMAILKRRYEFWFTIIALHKLGITIIPATHLLTKKILFIGIMQQILPPSLLWVRNPLLRLSAKRLPNLHQSNT